MGVDREKVVLETDLPGALSRRSGKVRDIYEYADGLLMVATDRISAFDCILPTGIPGKGRVLTGLSVFWFERTRHIIFNHLLSADVADFPAAVQDEADMLRGRAMWVRKAQTVPIECVVRGYLAGSGWKEYAATGKIGDHDLPAGLGQADKLPQPIFTPSIKAEKPPRSSGQNWPRRWRNWRLRSSPSRPTTRRRVGSCCATRSSNSAWRTAS